MLAGNKDQVGDGIVRVIDSPEKAKKLQAYLMKHQPVTGVDCETVGCNPKKEAPSNGRGRIVCWSLSFPYGEQRHSRTGAQLGCRVFLWAEALEWMRPWLESGAPKVGHNWTTYDHHMFLNHGILVNGIVGDTLRMSKLKNPSSLVRHDLKSLMYWRLGYKLAGYRELFSRPKRLAETVHKAQAKPSKRKVGEFVAVPTVWADGAVSVGFSLSARELIPLDVLRHDYPRLLRTLADYATLDAKGTVELYHLLERDLAGMPWQVGG